MKLKENIAFKKYKGNHKDQRVFIIGNGPSLADTNLDLLNDEITIAMNRVSLIYDKYSEWRPTYYLFSSTNVRNPEWGRAWTESVQKSIGEPRTTSFIARIFKDQIDPDNRYPQVKWFDSLSENKPLSDGTINENSFSTDIVSRIDKSGTTINLALQLAYYMGFNEIVFLGVDLGWVKDSGSHADPNHFDRSYRANISNPYKANHQMRNIHLLALKIFKENKNDVKLYNASKRTVLDVYPIIEFEQYVSNSSIILRNHDLQYASDFWSTIQDME